MVGFVGVIGVLFVGDVECGVTFVGGVPCSKAEGEVGGDKAG